MWGAPSRPLPSPHPENIQPTFTPCQPPPVIRKAEAFIIRRFVAKLPPDFAPAPVVHIVKSEVDTESVGHILVKKAEQLRATALVLSSHNRGKVAEFFLGSVTAFCTHRSAVPVVVVPNRPPLQPLAAAAAAPAAT